MATATRVREMPTAKSLLSRRRHVALAKRALPVVALLLLSIVAFWPQLAREFDSAKFGFRHGELSVDLKTGKLLNVRYHGVDARGRPYTITADEAQQIGPERIDMVHPKGDVVNENGSWTYAQSENGVYLQHSGMMDMSGDVTLYRDTGVTLRTATASMDMKAGAASSDKPTHVEGPFGTLDSKNGFALVDKGDIIQFDGPSRLLLNGTHQ